MLKIHQLFFFYKTNKSRTDSQNELFQILPLFTSSRGKSPAHLWRCPISINTALSEKLQSAITGDRNNVSTKEA